MYKWSEYEVNFLINNYPNNGSRYCAEHLNLDIKKVSSKAINLGLRLNKETRSRLNGLTNIKYSFNKDMFLCIDNGYKAYWLGFLLGDGSIDHKGYALHLELSQVDIDHLYKLRSFLQGNQKVFLTAKDCCKISFCGKGFVKSLEPYGLINNKTYSVITPKLNEDLLVDFYRGILDSDGWITEHKLKNSRSQYEYGFSSANMDFLCEIQTWLIKNIGRKVGYIKERIRNSQRVCQLIVGGNNNFIDITNLLYNNPLVYLDRKYTKIKGFLDILGL